MSIPAEVVAGLEHYQVAAPLRTVIERVTKVRSVTADTPGVGYVAVRPSAWGNVSAYFHKTYVDVALTPDKARSVEQMRSWPIAKINSETGYVRITSENLNDSETLDFATSLLSLAVDKSETGTAYEGGASAKHQSSRAQAICQYCNMQMPASGSCDNCD